jgi:hypothetical protein
MANYIPRSRTNYFRVNDLAKFEALAKECGIEYNYETRNGEIHVALFESPFSDDSVVGMYYNEITGDYDTIFESLQPLLPDGEAAIFMEIGNEKLRYLVAEANIVTNKEIIFRNLFADLAKEFNVKELF